MAGRKPDPWEVVAAKLVAKVLDGEVRTIDTIDGAEGVHDFEIDTLDGRTIALEVTRAADGEELARWDAAHRSRWKSRRQANDWWVTLGPHAPEPKQPIKKIVKALIPLLEVCERFGELDLHTAYETRYQRPALRKEDFHQAMVELYDLGCSGARILGPRAADEASILFSLTGGFGADPGLVNALVAASALRKANKLRKAEVDGRHLFVWIDASYPSAEFAMSKVGPAITTPEIPESIDVVWAVNGGLERLWRLEPPGAWQVLDLPDGAGWVKMTAS